MQTLSNIRPLRSPVRLVRRPTPSSLLALVLPACKHRTGYRRGTVADLRITPGPAAPKSPPCHHWSTWDATCHAMPALRPVHAAPVSCLSGSVATTLDLKLVDQAKLLSAAPPPMPALRIQRQPSPIDIRPPTTNGPGESEPLPGDIDACDLHPDPCLPTARATQG